MRRNALALGFVQRLWAHAGRACVKGSMCRVCAGFLAHGAPGGGGEGGGGDARLQYWVW